ncbi:MAG TPA: class I SAM-dependent methyltransferase [Candidatus Manganitrophaceae bacterium]|nr:class I SAM-dependent methyltransferase [Candidatus Manganitrophaceae bacterium]
MILSTDPLFEREYFEKYYTDYALQNPPRKMRFYRALAERAAEGIERPRILELGCAFGLFLSSLNPSWRRYGLDVSEFAIDRARRAVPDAKLSVSSAAEIPFDDSFDIIAAFDVIEHLPDLEKAALSVRSKLIPGGYFIFVVPVYDGPTGPLIRLLDRDPTHLRKESRDYWLDWARGRFQVIEWRGIYRYLLPGGYYLHRPTRMFRRYTPAIAVIARRGETD